MIKTDVSIMALMCLSHSDFSSAARKDTLEAFDASEPYKIKNQLKTEQNNGLNPKSTNILIIFANYSA